MIEKKKTLIRSYEYYKPNSFLLFAAVPEDALNDESDNEDKENPDSRISSKIINPLLCWINQDAMPTNFQPIRLFDPGCWYKFKYLMTNCADPDKLASKEATLSGSTLFVKAGYIWIQQDWVK